uniref:alpha-N-acetylgalactosaminide alpha-2,6-sialyltransferase n=1 Tax=Sinocyclocheilus grahami TaxID=75366 RepID=A0A672KDG2_SINGR
MNQFLWLFGCSLGILNTPANRLMFDDWENSANGSKCIRCAVVGNGGILNGSRKGKEIDEHDYVFRVNGAALKGMFFILFGLRSLTLSFSSSRFLHSRLLKTGARRIYRPSTGAVMLLAAIHTCDQVDAYGFMTPDYRLYSDHYYDKQQHPVHFYANHDMRMEMRLWQELHNAGLMNLFMSK